ncbi:FFLEELY motif protein [Spectribacter hydrogenooxidans]|uniref:DUF8198 domain-containing protein n=1 Tax=Spectribacter hydrogenoxidans TaxID=3075608 RepID=A0ABU3BZG9_9GAMM|nr:hypothetical protein [Salinisphaera sp. W335]MDT0634712.1 hypothetical protein [Salinisphaera sp. W335]
MTPPAQSELAVSLNTLAALAREPEPPALAGVRDFQRRRIQDNYGPDPILTFCTDRLLTGPDLSALTADPEATAARLGRLLGDTTAAAAALEFLALTETLDQAVATEATTPGEPGIIGFARASRRVGRIVDRHRQIDLVGIVVDELSGVATRRLSWMAFRMARTPARMAGFGEFYELLHAGFAAVRENPATVDRIPGWLTAERRRVERLLG